MLNPHGSTPTPNTDPAGARPGPEGLQRPRPVIDPSWRAGRKLEEARRQLGLSYEQIAGRIRVRREYLEALEAMNVKLLPGKAYAVAYLRSYAREVGLDANAIVRQFQDECALSREDAQPQIRQPESQPGRERPWLWVIVLFVLAAAFVGYRMLNSTPQESRPPAEVNAPAAALSTPGAGQATPAVRNVQFRALADAWLEVRGPDGTVFLARTLRAGENYSPDASAGWTVHARDGGLFEVVVDGRPAGLLGAPGIPVLGRQIDTIMPPPSAPAPTARPQQAPASSAAAPAQFWRAPSAAAPTSSATPPSVSAPEPPAPAPAPLEAMPAT